MKPGRLAIAAAGTAALVALASVERRPPPRPEPVPSAPREAEPARETPRELEDAFRKRPLGRTRDAFAARSWAPPPPPPKPAAAEPPRPVAPPLPFVFLGRVEDGGEPTVVLRRGQSVVLARERQDIDAQYRLESIGPRGLVVTYLPLNQQQLLPTPK